jgi:hypothetical protein
MAADEERAKVRGFHPLFVIVLFGLASIVTATVATTTAAQSGVRLGRPPLARTDKNENLRESCRRLIGGQYMTRHDEALQARRYLQVLKDQQKKMTTALTRERLKLAKLEAAASTGEFDATKATTRDILLGVVVNLEEQIKMNAGYLEQAVRGAEHKTVAAEMMRRRLSPVFKITEFKGEKNQLGYSFRVDFIAPCPRYQFQCPLPEAQGSALKTLLPGQDLPVECQRYAAIGAAGGVTGGGPP